MANRIKLLNKDEAPQQSQELLNHIQNKFGKIPNIFKMLANSPAVLKSCYNFLGALEEGKLDSLIRERIALLIAQKNGCEYCLAAHSAIAKGQGLAEEEIIFARQGKSQESKANSALKFADIFFEQKGNVSDIELNDIRIAGFSDEEVLEISATVILHIFTNSFNHLAQTEIDFPKVKSCTGCSCGCS